MAVDADIPLDPYEYGVPLRYLELLAHSPRNGGEDAVQKYYELRDARMMGVAKGAAAAILSILTAWFIPFLKNEYKDAPLALVVGPPIALLVALGAAAAMAFFNVNRIHRSLIRAMAVLEFYR